MSGNAKDTVFYYVHDPMCSWCWAHKPTWLKLESELKKLVDVEYLVGGLAPDSDKPMPEEQRTAVSGYWKKIQHLLGTEFNFDFWEKNTPRRSTYPACRAVLAAKKQGAEKAMITEIQKAYYLRALNPSDTETHIQLASELGLNVDQFSTDLMSDELQKAFTDELYFAHSLPIQGFPSMVLQHNEEWYPIPLDYKDYSGALKTVEDILEDTKS